MSCLPSPPSVLLAAAAVLAAPAQAGAQAPVVQNGTVEASPATIDAAIAAAGPHPAWVGWRVPMVPGDRDLCSTWSDGAAVFRGELLEPDPGGAPPRPAAPSPTVGLERGTGLVVLARIAEGRVERLRITSDACAIDAGGRTLRWLTSVSPAASVAFLDRFTRPDAPSVHASRRLAESAVFALGLHDAPEARTILERLTDRTSDAALRREAAAMLTSVHGEAGFTRVRTLFESEPDQRTRRQFVAVLARSPLPTVPEALAAIARTDADAGVRAEAAAHYVRRAGAPALDAALRLLDGDADPGVRRRIVSAIGALPADAGTPTLAMLARTHADLDVRKAAVAALGRSSAPDAQRVLEEFVR